MKYLSVCSGIEAATVAWKPLDWQAVAFSEIGPFCCDLLAHHYPDVPNMGDMTKYKEWKIDEPVDVIIGGTPCQSFSVAGLRKGLDDPRGNLALVFLGIIDRFKPRWVVWENVPGVLSDRTNAFGAFLGGLRECGYSCGYRVLDAQYFGLAQRRKRVFVVGHSGDWRRAAAVLLDGGCLRGCPAPSRKAGKKIATNVTKGAPFSGTGNERIEYDALIPEIVNCSRSSGPGFSRAGDSRGQDPLIPEVTETFQRRTNVSRNNNDCLVPEAVTQYGDIAGSITKRSDSSPCADRGQNIVAMRESGQGYWMEDDVAGAIRAEGENRPSRPGHIVKQSGYRVRRFTPREVERLFGFPDDYTLIPRKHGKLAADAPRYAALGNSIAVPALEWLGKRIDIVDKMVTT